MKIPDFRYRIGRATVLATNLEMSFEPIKDEEKIELSMSGIFSKDFFFNMFDEGVTETEITNFILTAFSVDLAGRITQLYENMKVEDRYKSRI